MRLEHRITKMQEEMLPLIPPEVLQTLFGETEKLVESGLAAKGLTVGDKIPSFSLPNAEGENVSSEQLLGEGPLVISFYRGSWCPYCNVEIKALQEQLPRIKELGAQLIAISPELPDNSLSFVDKHGLEFEVLSDVGNIVIRQFGLVFALPDSLHPIYQDFGFDIPQRNGDETWEVPIPATYVVNRDGTIIKAYVNADYTKRLEPAEIVEVLGEHARASR